MVPSSPPGTMQGQNTISIFCSRVDAMDSVDIDHHASWPRRQRVVRGMACTKRYIALRDCPPSETPMRACVRRAAGLAFDDTALTAPPRLSLPAPISHLSFLPPFRCMHHELHDIIGASVPEIHNKVGVLLRHLRITDPKPFKSGRFDKAARRHPACGFLKAHPALGVVSGWVFLRYRKIVLHRSSESSPSTPGFNWSQTPATMPGGRRARR